MIDPGLKRRITKPFSTTQLTPKGQIKKKIRVKKRGNCFSQMLPKLTTAHSDSFSELFHFCYIFNTFPQPKLIMTAVVPDSDPLMDKATAFFKLIRNAGLHLGTFEEQEKGVLSLFFDNFTSISFPIPREQDSEYQNCYTHLDLLCTLGECFQVALNNTDNGTIFRHIDTAFLNNIVKGFYIVSPEWHIILSRIISTFITKFEQCRLMIVKSISLVVGDAVDFKDRSASLSPLLDLFTLLLTPQVLEKYKPLIFSLFLHPYLINFSNSLMRLLSTAYRFDEKILTNITLFLITHWPITSGKKAAIFLSFINVFIQYASLDLNSTQLKRLISTIINEIDSAQSDAALMAMTILENPNFIRSTQSELRTFQGRLSQAIKKASSHWCEPIRREAIQLSFLCKIENHAAVTEDRSSSIWEKFGVNVPLSV